jgi:hypothetical protein
MSPFNRPGRPPITQTHLKYSVMGHKLSYGGSTSLHTQDYANSSEYLRESPACGGNVSGPSNPQTPGVNHQRGLGSRVRIVRGCGIESRLGHPDQRH